MPADLYDLPVPPAKRRYPRDIRDVRVVRRHDALVRIAQPLRRFLHKQVGRPWQAVQAELDARLLRLPASRFLRQRVRQMLLRALS